MLEQKAVEFAEKHGIIEYQMKGGEMVFYEKVFDGSEWIIFRCKVDLTDMTEFRTIEKII